MRRNSSSGGPIPRKGSAASRVSAAPLKDATSAGSQQSNSSNKTTASMTKSGSNVDSRSGTASRSGDVPPKLRVPIPPKDNGSNINQPAADTQKSPAQGSVEDVIHAAHYALTSAGSGGVKQRSQVVSCSTLLPLLVANQNQLPPRALIVQEEGEGEDMYTLGVSSPTTSMSLTSVKFNASAHSNAPLRMQGQAGSQDGSRSNGVSLECTYQHNNKSQDGGNGLIQRIAVTSQKQQSQDGGPTATVKAELCAVGGGEAVPSRREKGVVEAAHFTCNAEPSSMQHSKRADDSTKPWTGGDFSISIVQPSSTVSLVTLQAAYEKTELAVDVAELADSRHAVHQLQEYRQQDSSTHVFYHTHNTGKASQQDKSKLEIQDAARNRGTLSVANGCKYTGGFHASVPLVFNGYGSMQWSDDNSAESTTASCYEGSWKDGVREGEGQWRTCNNRLAYSGGWKGDRRSGKGKLTHELVSVGASSIGASRTVRMNGTWDNGKMDSSCTVSVNGKDVAVVSYRQGLITGTTVSFPTGSFNGKWSQALTPAVLMRIAPGTSVTPLVTIASTPTLSAAASPSPSQSSATPYAHLNAMQFFAHCVQRPLSELLSSSGSVVDAVSLQGLFLQKLLPLEVHTLLEQLASSTQASTTSVTAEQSSRVEALREGVASTQRVVGELDAEKQKTETAIAKAQQSLETEQQEVDALRRSVEDGSSSDEATPKVLEDRQKELAQEIKKASQTVAQMQSECKQAKSKISAVEKEFKALETEAAQLRAHNDKCGSALTAARDKHKGQFGEYEDLVKQSSESKASIATAVDELLNKIELMEKENQGRMESIRSRGTPGRVLSDLKDAVGAIEREIQIALERREALEKKIPELSADNERQEKELKIMSDTTQEWQGRISNAKATATSLKQELKQAREGGSNNSDGRGSVELDDAAIQEAFRDEEQRLLARHEKSCRNFSERITTTEERLRCIIEAINSLQRSGNAALIKLLKEDAAAKKTRLDGIIREIQKLASKQFPLIHCQIDGLERNKQKLIDLEKKKVAQQKANDDAFSTYVGASSSGMADGATAEEMKEMITKLRHDVEGHESRIVEVKQELAARQQQLEAAKAEAERQKEALNNNSSTSGGDWRIRPLQNEVDSREGVIADLRMQLSRRKQLESKLTVAQETLSGLEQSAENKEQQSVSKAQMDIQRANARAADNKMMARLRQSSLSASGVHY